MLDEIINYIQSLQRQVEVKKINKPLLPLCYNVAILTVSVYTVSVNEARSG